MSRDDEIKYLLQNIYKIEESEKSNNPITEITIKSWMFVELARLFLSYCYPHDSKKAEKELTVISR